MGMYTQLRCNIDIKRDTPLEVINMLKYMVGDLDIDLRHFEGFDSLKHPLFQSHRWHMLFTCSSAYFDDWEEPQLIECDDYYQLTVCSNLKNYDSEIQKFWDWIKPYINANEGEWLGAYRYEENEWDTNVRYLGNDEIEFYIEKEENEEWGWGY